MKRRSSAARDHLEGCAVDGAQHDAAIADDEDITSRQLFGLNTLGALMRSKKLAGSELALVDMNAETLAIVRRLADRLNQEWEAKLTITAHTRHQDALPGAQFVVSAIEVPPRERLWRMDWEIPLRHGVRQPYAENGGPGGFAHACRNIGPVLQIAHDMEQACPQAWFINYTNPMVRICDAIHRYSKIKAIGLCHQIFAGYGMVAYLLADKLGIERPADMHGPGSFLIRQLNFWISKPPV